MTGKSRGTNKTVVGAGLALVITALPGPTYVESEQEIRVARLLFGGACLIGGSVAIGFSSQTVQDGATTQWSPTNAPRALRAPTGIAVNGAF